MAHCLSNPPRRIVSYWSSLSNIARHIRHCSSNQRTRTIEIQVTHEPFPQKPGSHWPDSRLGGLAPVNLNYPLPGEVGPSGDLVSTAAQKQIIQLVKRSRPVVPTQQLFMDIEATPMHHERYEEVLTQMEHVRQSEDDSLCFDDSSFECIAHECPHMVRRDLQPLFPQRNMMQNSLTVVTVSQKTVSDQRAWNDDNERETLMENFVRGAQEICEAFVKQGYWADFIDPSSGRPFYSQYTNTTLFETDPVFHKLGFEIEDLGCCKVVKHVRWGSKVFVGCIITEAPTDHPVIMQLSEDD